MFNRLFRAKTPASLARVVNPRLHASEVAYYSPMPHGGWRVEHWGFGDDRDVWHGTARVETERQALDFINIAGNRVPMRVA